MSQSKLERWIIYCTQAGHNACFCYQTLCRDCAHTYACQRVKAMLKHAVTEISRFSRLPAQTDTAGIVQDILSTIRALKVEP